MRLLPLALRISVSFVLLLRAHAESACPAAPRGPAGATAERRAAAAGEWFAARGLQSCAADSFRQGLTQTPRSAPLHYGLAMSLLASHQAEAAQQELHTVLTLAPHATQAYLVLGVLAHGRGERDQALRYWQDALREDSNSVTAIDWIAKTRMEAGQYTEALDLLRTSPPAQDLAVDYLLAASKAALVRDAITTSGQALAAHPEWNRLRVALATILVQQNRFEDAVAQLQKASDVDPGSLEIQVLRLRVLVLKGDAAQARPEVDRLLAAHPDKFDALYLGGLLRRQNGEFAAALPLLQAAVAQQPNHFDARFNLGVDLARLHRIPEALAHLRYAASLPEATPEAHFQLAAALRSSGDAQAAEAETRLYREQIAERAQHDELVSLSAQAADKLRDGDGQGAAEVERTILSRHPEQAIHWYNLARALESTGDAKGAAVALEHAVALQPTLAVAWNELGYLRAQGGEAQGAEAAFRAAIAAAPQYAEAENNLGSLLMQKGDAAQAETYFRAALAANPRSFDSYLNLAAALASQGRLQAAREAATNALSLQPGNADARRMLSMLSAPSAMPAVLQ